MKTLILIPLSFPYDKCQEDTFLKHEIVFLKESFLKFIILPNENTGKRMVLDKSYVVDESFAEYNRTKKRIDLYAVFSPLFFNLFIYEIFTKPSLLIKMAELKKVLGFIKNTVNSRNFFKKYLSLITKKDEEIILYTYWSTYITLSLGILAKSNPKISVITRMHGSDLFEERGFIVCQKQILQRINYVFFVSENGRDYLVKKYNNFRDKFKIAPLGVEEQTTLNPWSYDNKIRIVSCSTIDSNKRVELIFDALKIIAASGKMISWTHFGSGEKEDDLKIKISQNLFTNFNCILMGQVSSDILMEYYRKNQVDVFLTVTASEGGRPVSIQEALSFGIPVIATSVGGIPEIVNTENGILLNPDPTPFEISRAIETFFSEKELIAAKRKSSYMMWSLYCDKDKNFKDFDQQLQLI